jgi:hypothetical protein
MTDHRPANGGGSCARCRGRLDLAAVKQGDVWYCSTGCADGQRRVEPRGAEVPEAWLYARPRRFFGARKPKELRSAGGGRAAH